jgi:Peptidase family M28
MGSEMLHLNQLAGEIGPRPATTDAEARAADYIQGVFEQRGLEVERQEFDAPHTYSWAYVIYHVLTIGCAVGSKWAPWPAFGVALVVAIVFFYDLDTRFGLSSLMPKGPSQNVIARHVPKAWRGERTSRIVIVAHYDSAKSSLAFSPSMVKSFAFTFGLMKWCTYLVPVAILVEALPWTAKWMPYTWYAAMAVSAYLLVPLFINIHRELFMKATDGANDNASGVATMLEVMERVVPAPEGASASTTGSMPRVRRTAEDAWAADVVPQDSLLQYSPTEAPAPAPDVWATTSWDASDVTEAGWEPDDGRVSGQTEMDMNATPRTAAPTTPPVGPVPATERRHAPSLDMDIDMDLDLAPDEPAVPRSVWEAPTTAPDAAAVPGGPATTPEPEPPSSQHKGVREWLGVGRDFDARKKGRDIGSWDNFEEDDDDTGRKGGAAGVDDMDDPGFTASEAARIRRKVTEGLDRALADKEVWFVATGAEEVGTAGMKAFLKECAADLREAVILNLDNLGSGSLYYITSEGMSRHYDGDRRLISAAKRVVREREMDIRGREYRGLSTDATPALARHFRALSVMAFDINGRLPDWHWKTDTVENVTPENLTKAADFVTEMVREL